MVEREVMGLMRQVMLIPWAEPSVREHPGPDLFCLVCALGVVVGAALPARPPVVDATTMISVCAGKPPADGAGAGWVIGNEGASLDAPRGGKGGVGSGT